MKNIEMKNSSTLNTINDFDIFPDDNEKTTFDELDKEYLNNIKENPNLIRKIDFVGKIKKDDFLKGYKKVYDKNHQARKHYSDVLFLSHHCCYCGINNSQQIDHYLSKTEYPCYAVSLFNWVPVCASCNNLKNSKSVDSNIYFINPYFHIIDYEWMYFDIKFNSNGIQFVFNPHNINQTYYDRIEYTIINLDLIKKYENELIQCFNDDKELFIEKYKRSSRCLKKFLKTKAESVIKNDINVALYKCLFKNYRLFSKYLKSII